MFYMFFQLFIQVKFQLLVYNQFHSSFQKYQSQDFMQSSLRQFKIKSKVAKMKRSVDAFYQKQLYNLNSSFRILKKQDFITENNFKNQVSSIKQTPSDNRSSFAFEVLSAMKTNDSKQFSDENLYQPLSLSHKRKCRPKMRTLSYRNQREKSVIKTQEALKDLQQINQFKINRFINVNNTLRFNEDIDSSDQILAFCPYSTIEQLKRKKLRSPSKGKSLIGKRAKTSPIKIRNIGSPNRKTNTKNLFRIKEFSNSPSLLLGVPPLLPKNSSISAWEIPQQDY